MAETVNLAGPSSGLPEISTVAFNAAVNAALAEKADVAEVAAAAATVDAALTQKANIADLAVISTTIQSVQNIALDAQQKTATNGLSLDSLAQAVTVLQSRTTGVESRVTVLETATPPPATPNVVASFSLGATTNTTQVGNWTAPASGPAPTGYQMRYRLTNGNGTWINGPLIAFPTLTGTWTGLTQGTSYDYDVVTRNAAGPGAVSATLTKVTTATFTPSAAWTEITNNTGTITMADGGVVSIVNGVMKLTPLGGAIGNMGTTGAVILALVSDIGRVFHESNDPSLAANPGGVGWWYWDAVTPWVWSADPRTVTPPTGLRNPNTIPFASDSVWNIGIGKTTATWASAGAAETISLRSLGLAVNGAFYGQPIYFGKASDPEISFTCTGDGIDGILPFTQLMHCPVTATIGLPTNGDRHITVYDATRPLIAVTLFFASFPTGNILGGVQGFLGSILDLTKNGIKPGNVGSLGADMVGSRNWSGGVITAFDIGAGVIRHMVRMSFSQNSLQSPNPTPGDMTGTLWPNYYVDYDHAPAQYSGIIPAGTFGIPGSVNLTTLGLSAGGMMLAKCLQDYGGTFRDSGGTSQFTFYTTPEMDQHPLIVGMRNDGPKIRAVMARMTNQAQWGAISPPGSGHLNRTPPAISAYNGGATGRVAPLPPVGVA